MVHQTTHNQEELYHLYEISRAVNSSLDLKTVLQFILDMTTDLFKADAGSIMLLQEEKYLTIEVAQGLSREVITNTKVPLGEGIAGWVAQTGEPLLLDGKVADSKFKRLINRKEEIQSSLCVPLKTKDKVIGVLMLRNPSRSSRFTETHLRFLATIGDQVSIAIENARLYRYISYEKMKVEAIISNMADGLIVSDMEGKILLMNPAAEKIFGIDRESAVNKHRSILFSGLDLEDIHQKAVREEKTFAKEIALNKPTQLFFRILITPMKTVEGLTQGVISLLQDITELRKVAEMKSQFVSMVTHDLKTPLTSIQGFVEIILTRNPSLEKIHNYLQIVREETARLVRIINNLLDLAKLESGEFKLNSSSINLTQLIQEALPIFSKKSGIHKILFQPSVPVSNVWADPDLIIQVLYNLLSNAIKYSPEGGKIEIRIKPAGNFVEVDVEDEGIGIPPEKLPKLFEKFYRVDSKITKGIEGTGIGLANVKYIVEAHGGSLRVKSSEGKGSLFTFSLPIFIPHPNMPPRLKDQQNG